MSQSSDNGSYSEAVAGVQATKGPRGEVDPALVGNPGNVAGAEPETRTVRPPCRKEKERAEKLEHKDQRSRTSQLSIW